MRMLASLLLIVLVQGPGTLFRTERPAALPDLLLLNSRVITMDTKRPQTEAIVVTGERITWTGTDEEARSRFANAKRIIDLQGKTILPGLIDAHVHLLELGKSLLRLNLKDVADANEAVARVKERVASVQPNEWILGWGWDEGKWAANYPTNEELSKVSPNNPVFLVGLHSFASWANKQALRAAGVTPATKDPDNGKILRDEKTGEPTGILLNRAQALVDLHIPPLSIDQTKHAISLAAKECVRNGLTSVDDARVSRTMLQAFREMIQQGQLPLRIYAMLDGADRELVDEWLKRGPEIDANHRLTIRSFKLFADGALGSRGALMQEPYADAPGTVGVATTPGREIFEFTRRSLRSGFQVCTHAIGDAANHMVLQAYSEALMPTNRLASDTATGSRTDPRLRVEHAQVLAPEDIPLFAKFGIIPSMQPTHCTSDMAWAEKRVGSVRIRGAYAWRSLLKTGAHLPLSSDFPGETLNPFYGIYAAITRQDPVGNPAGGWYPEQRLTLDEALRGYTLEAAFAEFEESNKGSIEPNKLADLIVISSDIIRIPPKEILSIRVLKTFIGGRLIFEADEAK